jgi:hypothetical protein
MCTFLILAYSWIENRLSTFVTIGRISPFLVSVNNNGGFGNNISKGCESPTTIVRQWHMWQRILWVE